MSGGEETKRGRWSVELRDPERARERIAAGLWLTRLAEPHEDLVAPTLRWAYIMAAEGAPLPSLGWLADLAQCGLGAFREHPPRPQSPPPPAVDAAVLRRYEDYAVGRLFSDASFQRGTDGVLRYSGERRDRALAFLVERFQERAGFGGVILSPAVLKALLQLPPAEVLELGWRALDAPGSRLGAELSEEYSRLVDSLRAAGPALGSEDIFELEQGTAVAAFGQRVALRQALRAADALGADLPRRPPRRPVTRHQVATRILDEDTYPVGGFSSLSNKGTVESLLQSQLALMERDERPDLFDIKFVRDELLYYSRDENQFLRRRRSFVVALFPDTERLRAKDAELPWQRIVLLLGLIAALVRRLGDWLGDDSLLFRFVFVGDAGRRLAAERELLETLFRDLIESGLVELVERDIAGLVGDCQQLARRSQCRLVTIGQEEHGVDRGRNECEGIECSTLSVIEGVPRWRELGGRGGDARLGATRENSAVDPEPDLNPTRQRGATPSHSTPCGWAAGPDLETWRGVLRELAIALL